MPRPGGNVQNAEASLSYELRKTSKRNSETQWEGDQEGDSKNPGAKELCCHQRLRHKAGCKTNPAAEWSCQQRLAV